MGNNIHNIHDKFVKASFSDQDRAIAFFEKFLPEKILVRINIYSLRILQESYIQNDLSEHFSDIIFEVDTIENESILISLLFEHKSSPDKNILIQIGHYMFSHWYKSVKEKKKLKPIIPIIYYQGKMNWDLPQIDSLFPNFEKDILDFIPDINNIFIGLNTLSEDTIIGIRDQLMAAAILAQKNGLDADKLASDFLKIMKLFPEKENIGNFISQIVVYIVSLTELPKEKLKQVLDSLPSQSIKQNIMTTYLQIKNEGIEEGMEKGMEKGKLEKTIEIILNGFDNGLSISMICNITQFSESEVINILRMHDRAI
jgi:predicted transposase/invertase (TIGR01784 family)